MLWMMALMVILASWVAIALNQISCEWSRCDGTTKAELITGSNDQDLILALDGNDTIYTRTTGNRTSSLAVPAKRMQSPTTLSSPRASLIQHPHPLPSGRRLPSSPFSCLDWLRFAQVIVGGPGSLPRPLHCPISGHLLPASNAQVTAKITQLGDAVESIRCL